MKAKIRLKLSAQAVRDAISVISGTANRGIGSSVGQLPRLDGLTLVQVTFGSGISHSPTLLPGPVRSSSLISSLIVTEFYSVP